MTDTIMPVTGMSGMNSGWGAGVGGFLGAAIGNGGLFGYGNRGYGAVGEGVSTTILNDGINQIQSAINSGNTANLQGFAGLNSTTLQSSAILQNATNQGFAGLNATVNTVGNSIQNSTNQGFAGLNTSILTSSRDEIQAIKDCCCETQKTIIAEGCATRELINSNYAKGLEVALCDAKAKIGSLESQAFTTASNERQTAVILGHLAAAVGK